MNMMKMMKQAADMQKNMAKVQEALAAQELEFQSGGGAVTVTISGDGTIRRIRIDPAAVEGGDAEMLEDLVLAAVKDAMANAQALAAEKMGRATGGMNLPGMF